MSERESPFDHGDCVKRESALVLIEDAQRWEHAYVKERDRLARIKEILLTGLATDRDRPAITEALGEIGDV